MTYSLAFEQAAIIPEAFTLHAVALHCTASSQCLSLEGNDEEVIKASQRRINCNVIEYKNVIV